MFKFMGIVDAKMNQNIYLHRVCDLLTESSDIKGPFHEDEEGKEENITACAEE